MPVIPYIIAVALAVGWFVADLRGSVTTRRTIGIVALLWLFGLATVGLFLQSLDLNAYFTSASKELLHTSVQQLRAGRTEVVIQALSHADDKFQWTYETRGEYREVVDEAVTSMDHP